MVDHDVVARKIANASARLADIERLSAKPREDFLADVERRDLTAFYVQLAIQECVLADHGLISHDLATTMRQAVGLRNLIAHGYATIDHGRLYDEVGGGTSAIRRFLAALADAADL